MADTFEMSGKELVTQMMMFRWDIVLTKGLTAVAKEHEDFVKERARLPEGEEEVITMLQKAGVRYVKLTIVEGAMVATAYGLLRSGSRAARDVVYQFVKGPSLKASYILAITKHFGLPKFVAGLMGAMAVPATEADLAWDAQLNTPVKTCLERAAIPSIFMYLMAIYDICCEDSVAVSKKKPIESRRNRIISLTAVRFCTLAAKCVGAAIGHRFSPNAALLGSEAAAAVFMKYGAVKVGLVARACSNNLLAN